MFDKVSRAKDYACIEVEGSRDLPKEIFFIKVKTCPCPVTCLRHSVGRFA